MRYIILFVTFYSFIGILTCLFINPEAQIYKVIRAEVKKLERRDLEEIKKNKNFTFDRLLKMRVMLIQTVLFVAWPIVILEIVKRAFQDKQT